jgi:hypothetical protein
MKTKLITKLLQDADLSEVSEDSGVSMYTLQHLRAGRGPLSSSLAERILLALDCETVDWKIKAALRFGKPYIHAIVKFNNFAGALLCNGCGVIISEGFNHLDKRHYCEDCKTVRTAKHEN